jgi:hypothetical protein
MVWLRLSFAIFLIMAGVVFTHASAAQPSDSDTDAEKIDRSARVPTNTTGPKVIVDVDLSTQSMHVQFPDGTEETWLIASGRPGLDTPDGKYKAQWVDPDHISKQYQDAPMPYAVFFDLKGHAFHGSYQKTFGRAVSHGCIRLAVDNAKKLFEAVEKSGADVTITGRAPRKGGTLVARHREPADYGDGYDNRPNGQNAYTYRTNSYPAYPQQQPGFFGALFGR